MKKNHRETCTKIALCCSGFGMISNAIFVPASVEIMKAFPNAGEFLTGYVLSGNFIMSVPFALLSAWLARYISKKKLLIAALFMFFAGGFGNAFVPDMYFMAAARTLDAASDGVITTIAASLIAEVYKDEKTQSQVLGRKEAVSSVLGIFTGILSGLLVGFSWRFAFALNAFSLIPLVFGIIFIPDSKPERERSKEKFHLDAKTAVHILGNLCLFGLIQLIVCQVIYLIAAIIEEEGFGGSVYAGAMTSIINISMFFAYMAFSPVYMKMKRKLHPVMFLAAGGAMILMTVSGKEAAFTVFVVLAAFAGAMSYPYYSVLIAQDAPEVQVSFWMSIYSVVTYTVASFSTYVPGIIEKVFHISSILETFFYSGGLLLLTGIVLAGKGMMKKSFS